MAKKWDEFFKAVRLNDLVEVVLNGNSTVLGYYDGSTAIVSYPEPIRYIRLGPVCCNDTSKSFEMEKINSIKIYKAKEY